MKTALIKLLASLMSDDGSRKKVLIAVLSAVAGFLGLMLLPVAVLSSMGSIEPSEIDKEMFSDSALYAGLDSETRQQLDDIQNVGAEIENAMSNAGVRSQTIKAQLIYLSFFENVENFNAEEFAELFATAADDENLIESINQKYGLSIDYNEFLRTYTLVMNSTINRYMFTDESSKNAADLAAWADNAYVSGWGFSAGAIGEKDNQNRIRNADNAGLMLGYLNYFPDEKAFGNNFNTLVYTEQGDISTMPEVAGIGLYDGKNHGIYVCNGEVIWSDENLGYVTKDIVLNGGWTKWCTYEGVSYPQEVQDSIENKNSANDNSEENSDSTNEQNDHGGMTQ